MVSETEQGQAQVVRKKPDQKLTLLIDGAKSGDRTCMEELVILHHKEIFHMVYYRTGSQMDAEDLTQEIFIRMSKKLRQLKDPDRFRGWLHLIALNQIKDFHRKRRLLFFFSNPNEFEKNELTPKNDNPEKQVLKKQFWHHFFELTQKMPRMEREVFTLRYLDQLNIREIAETLKRNESTIKTHLYRALKKFRKSSDLRALLKGNEL